MSLPDKWRHPPGHFAIIDINDGMHLWSSDSISQCRKQLEIMRKDNTEDVASLRIAKVESGPLWGCGGYTQKIKIMDGEASNA